MTSSHSAMPSIFDHKKQQLTLNRSNSEFCLLDYFFSFLSLTTTGYQHLRQCLCDSDYFISHSTSHEFASSRNARGREKKAMKQQKDENIFKVATLMKSRLVKM